MDPAARSQAGGGPTGIYLHIPYCLSKCPYCDFNTYAVASWPEDAYSSALCAELSAHAAGGRIDHGIGTIFFGGGTPSLFAPGTISRILSEIARVSTFDADAEITLEANPGTVDRAHLSDLRAAGVNRLSLGVQSFSDRSLTVLGRRHSVEESRQAIRAARAAGFDNLSIDLMYAVPGQDQRACEQDVRAAIDEAPEHISAYCLTYEKGTPMQRDLQKGRITSVGEDAEAAMFTAVRAGLDAAGYGAYEISNHARPGFEARHNRSYWRGQPYLGLGAGAHSFLPRPAGDERWGTRWQNLRDPNPYVEAITREGSAVDSQESLSRAQAMGEACWLGLRESRGIDADDFAQRFDESLAAAYPHADSLVREGLLTWNEERLVLSEAGVLVADSIFASFF